MKPLPGLAARWNTLAPRERQWLAIGIAVVVLALLWWVALAPALQTLRSAEAQHQALDAQLQQMRSLQAQAQALQAQPRVGHDEALRALEASVAQRLAGTGQLNVVGDRATVTLRGSPPEALAQWLTQVRVNARAAPGEARLVRRAQLGAPVWDGTIVLSLPQR